MAGYYQAFSPVGTLTIIIGGCTDVGDANNSSFQTQNYNYFLSKKSPTVLYKPKQTPCKRWFTDKRRLAVDPCGAMPKREKNVDVMKRFGERIRHCRERRNWSQDQLAEHSGLTREFISGIENGRREPCLGAIHQLAQSFEITIAQLMRGV